MGSDSFACLANRLIGKRFLQLDQCMHHTIVKSYESEAEHKKKFMKVKCVEISIIKQSDFLKKRSSKR